MNRTPRSVGSTKAAVKAVFEITQRAEIARKRREALAAMAAIHGASVKPKGPRRDSKGRFVKAS